MAGRPVLDEAVAGSGRVGALHHELDGLQRAMADPNQAGDMDRLLERFGTVQEEYDHLGGYGLEAQAREVLHGLGFGDERIDGDVGALSGGWKMRVAMARVLLGRPDVLLMDEPTNHLDIESIIWLEGFLASYSGALLMTSHDRSFMNRVVAASPRSTAARSPLFRQLRLLRARACHPRGHREAAYARQQAMLAKEQRFIERFAAHAAKAAQVQSRVKALEKIGRSSSRSAAGWWRSTLGSRPGRAIRWPSIDGVSKAYGRRVVYDGMSLTIRRGERWCVMGEERRGQVHAAEDRGGGIEP